ncbi:tape measure protein [Lysinibacillus sp. NPDC086135]|uniref:tape measure protein n=1 Tax=Lysinibacillus sp. NPDC086135 TaxID=3364130 RepID=UPI00380FC271
MAGDGRVVIDVILDDGKVTKGVANVGNKIDGVGSSAYKATLGLGRMITALGLIAATRKGIEMVTSAIGGAVARVDTLNGFPVVMERMGFSSEQAKASIDKLSNGIQGLPTTLDGIVKSAQNIALMTGDLNVATETALALNNAFLASGSSSADAERGLVQYVQMLSKGKVDMVSWQTLQETMGFALNKTAEAFGFTGKAAQRDLYTALQKGKITFEDFNTKLIELNNGVGGFAEIAQAGSAGIATSFTNMKTAVVRGTANIIQAIQDVLAKTPLQSIENILGLIGKAFSDFLNSIAAGIPTAANTIMNLYNALESWLPLMSSIVIGVGTVFTAFLTYNSIIAIIDAVKKSQLGLAAVMMMNPWALAAAAAIAAVVLIIKYWEPITQFFSDIWAKSLAVFNNALTAIQSFATAMSETVSKIATTLSTSLGTAWSSVSNGFTAAINGLLTGLSSLKEKLSIVTDIINVEQALNLLKTAAMAVLSSVLMLMGPWGIFASILLKVFTHTTLLQDTFKMLKGEMTFDEVASNFTTSISNIISNIAELATRLIPLGAEMIVNLINGVSNNIGNLSSAFAEILPVIINTLVTIIPQLLLLAADIVTKLAEGLTTSLPIMVEAIVSLIELVTTTIGTLLPQLVEVGISLLTTIINGIVTALPMLIEVVVQLLDTIINNLTTMLPMLIDTGLTIVETLLNGILTALPLVIESALNIIMSLVDALITALPQLIQVGLLVLNTLIEGIIGALPTIIEAALTIIIALVGALILLLPQIIEAGIKIIMALVQGLIKAIPALIEAALTLIMSLVEALIKLLPQLIDAGIKIVEALVKGLIQVLPQLIEAGITLITELSKAMLKLQPQLLAAGVKLIVALTKGVLSILGQLLSAGGQLILGLLGKILSFTGQLLSSGATLIGKLVFGILSLIGNVIGAGATLITGLIDKILSFVSNILTVGKDLVGSLIDGIVSKVTDMINVGKDLVNGLIEGILGMAGNAIEAITGVVDGVVNKAKSLLGIHSPSRVFKQIGIWTIEGMEIGMEERKASIKQVMTDITNSLLGITNHYQSENKKLTQKANSEIALIEKRSKEDIDKIYRNAYAKKRKTTKDENLKIQRIQEDAAKKIAEIEKKSKKESHDLLTKEQQDKLKEIKLFIEDKKSLNELSLVEEIKIWEKALDHFDMYSKERVEAQKALKKAMEDLNKENLEKIKQYVSDKKSLDQLSLIEEEKIWEESINLFEEGSKERIEAQRNHQKAVEAVNKEITSINKEYLDQMKKIDDDYIKEAQRLNKEYEDAYNKRVSTLMGFASTFDAFKVELDRTGYELMENLQSQVDGIKDWQDQFAKLSERGIDADLLKELSDLGVKALPELAALNSMTDDQLSRYSDLYKEKSQLAREQAEKELSGMRKDTDQKLLELRQTADTQLSKLQTEWDLKIKNLVRTTDSELATLKQVGINAGQGLLDGLASMESDLINKAQDIANAIKDTMQSALDIHSPSRWMRDFIVGNLAKGFDVGVDKHKNLITKASGRFGEMIKPDIVNKLRGVKANLGTLGTSLQSVANTNKTITYDHSRKVENKINMQQTGNDRSDLERLLRRLEFEMG